METVASNALVSTLRNDDIDPTLHFFQNTVPNKNSVYYFAIGAGARENNDWLHQQAPIFMTKKASSLDPRIEKHCVVIDLYNVEDKDNTILLNYLQRIMTTKSTEKFTESKQTTGINHSHWVLDICNFHFHYLQSYWPLSGLLKDCSDGLMVQFKNALKTFMNQIEKNDGLMILANFVKFKHQYFPLFSLMSEYHELFLSNVLQKKLDSCHILLEWSGYANLGGSDDNCSALFEYSSDFNKNGVFEHIRELKGNKKLRNQFTPVPFTDDGMKIYFPPAAYYLDFMMDEKENLHLVS